MNEIEQFVAARVKNAPVITPETSVTRDLGLDSLAIMDLLMALEDEFDVSIPLNYLPDIETVGDLASAIEKIKNGTVKA